MVKFYAPELDPGDDSADAQIEQAIVVASRRITPAAFDALYEDALACLAAHLLIMGERTTDHPGAAGAIQSEKTGDWSRTYAMPANISAALADAALKQTNPGLEYLSIRSSRVATTGRLIQ